MDDFQKQQLEALRSNNEYKEATIYTILYDLVEGNDATEVYTILHQVATEQGQRKDLEETTVQSKWWEWNHE